MSAKRSESRTGSSRAAELAAVLICQYRFAAIFLWIWVAETRRIDGVDWSGMMARYRGWEVLKALILDDHVMWRLNVDKEMSLFRLLQATTTKREPTRIISIC